MHHDANKPVIKRLARIEGQVRGVAAMVEDGRYCIDILDQVQAIKAALRKVEDVILKNHSAHCVEAAIKDGDEHGQREKFSELVELFGRYRT
ncbi:MAG: metal-sensitive transcriptional regulator [Parvularculaceae bacterium]|nr:metal-sensitive transcriptional regulator [Parvularculaceae bacterium]